MRTTISKKTAKTHNKNFPSSSTEKYASKAKLNCAMGFKTTKRKKRSKPKSRKKKEPSPFELPKIKIPK